MLEDLLSPELEQIIVDTIKRQCYRYKNYEKNRKSLYYELYEHVRRKGNLTAAVLSGFAPDRFKKEGIQVRDLKYGAEHISYFQPELSTEKAVIQIYSNGARLLHNKPSRQACKMNSKIKNGKRFLLIQFHADTQGNLKKIEVIYPDEFCEIQERKIIYGQAEDGCLAKVG